VPLSLVTRLEEFSVDKVESSNGRDLVQYRGSLMPLVYFDEHLQRKTEGSVPMLVFSDAGRSMGLVVDEIIDIVEDRLDIQVGSDRPGILGSAVIKTKATEVVDIGHFLPQAFEDWFQRKEMVQENLNRSLLFVDDAPFFRNMLGPVLKAAGYQVTLAESAKEAISYFEEGRKFDVVVSDIEMPEMNGFEFAEALKRSPRLKHIPILALSASCTPASIERGRQAGFDDYIAKFDRAGLIAALKEVSNYEYGVAA
jgi:two-component system chemotaxis sensor kinase CheA